MGLSEADTRAKLIDPKLKASGWTDRQVTREYYYQRDHQYTPGRIVLISDRARRGSPRKVDYLRRLTWHPLNQHHFRVIGGEQHGKINFSR
jgi:type I restriction enzyme R subunit